MSLLKRRKIGRSDPLSKGIEKQLHINCRHLLKIYFVIQINNLSV